MTRRSVVYADVLIILSALDHRPPFGLRVMKYARLIFLVILMNDVARMTPARSWLRRRHYGACFFRRGTSLAATCAIDWSRDGGFITVRGESTVTL